MIQRPDIAVYSQDDELQLVVEVKNKQRADAEWAANLRRNLFAHSAVPNSPYFLLAMPDQFYLWKNTGPPADIKPPDYMGDSKPVLEPYLNASDLDTMSEYGLELIIKSWLNKLVNANLTRETAKPHESWLFDSGLYNAIRHGYVKAEAATV